MGRIWGKSRNRVPSSLTATEEQTLHDSELFLIKRELGTTTKVSPFACSPVWRPHEDIHSCLWWTKPWRHLRLPSAGAGGGCGRSLHPPNARGPPAARLQTGCPGHRSHSSSSFFSEKINTCKGFFIVLVGQKNSVFSSFPFMRKV